MRVALAVAFFVAAAGCVSLPDASPPDAAAALLPSPADPFFVQHDHWNASEHAVALNMVDVHWDPLASFGEQSGAHVVDVHESTLLVGTTARETNGFHLFDVSNPEEPKLLGRFHTDTPLGDDRTIMFSADGGTVFVGGAEDVLAVDVSDPANPAEVARYTNPQFGAHTLFAEEVDGTQFVYVVGYGLITLSYEPGAFTFLSRYVAATPAGLADTPLGPDGTTYAIRDTYGHDVYVEKDPETGQHLAYVAYAYEGLKIVDLSNPRLPVEVATWRPGGEAAPWYVHTIWLAHLDGKRIAVVGSEVFENRHVATPSPVWVLDLSDLASPELVASWVNPGGKGSDNLLFSAHDLRITPEGLVPLSHYHGGVWLLDLRDPDAVISSGELPVLGYALPHRDNGWRPEEACCFGFNLGGIPVTFDVLMHGDYLFAADLHTGLHVFRYVPPAADASA